MLFRSVRGVPNGTVTFSSLAFPGSALPVVGDFDGDGDEDVLFYRSGIATVPLAEWDGATGATVTNLSRSGGPYRPVVGDFEHAHAVGPALTPREVDADDPGAHAVASTG